MSDPTGSTKYCWRCHYSLYGIDDVTRCPECGLPVSISLELAPVTMVSRTTKWCGIAALLVVLPLSILGFVILSMTTPSQWSDISIYLGTISFVLAACAGISSSMFLKSPTELGTRVPFYASIAFYTMLGILGSTWVLLQSPLKEQVELDGSIWQRLISLSLLAVVAGGLGSLSLQASLYCRRMTQLKRAHSFRWLSCLAFGSATILCITIPMTQANSLTLFDDHWLPARLLGLGMLLAIAASIYWTILISLTSFTIARLPIRISPINPIRGTQTAQNQPKNRLS